MRQERDDLLNVREEAAEDIRRLIEVERQENMDILLQNQMLEQELDNHRKVF